MGSRTTGNDAGCYMVAGPDWKGGTPADIKEVFHSETQFGAVGYRTQLFGPSDMPNVNRIQARYKVQTLSQFLKQPAPPAAPAIEFPPFTKDDIKMPFPKFLNFFLQFCPPNNDEEKAGRAYTNLLLTEQGQKLIEKAGFVRIRFSKGICPLP